MSDEQCGACDVDLAALCSCGVELVTLSLCQQCWLQKLHNALCILARVIGKTTVCEMNVR